MLAKSDDWPTTAVRHLMGVFFYFYNYCMPIIDWLHCGDPILNKDLWRLQKDVVPPSSHRSTGSRAFVSPPSPLVPQLLVPLVSAPDRMREQTLNWEVSTAQLSTASAQVHAPLTTEQW